MEEYDFLEKVQPQFPFSIIKKNYKVSARKYKVPDSCKSCVHFEECEGGCMRDSALYGRGIYGKFHYCESWQEVFSRVKESIITGEADGALRKYGHNPETIRSRVLERLNRSIKDGQNNMRRPVLSLGHIPTFPDEMYRPDLT